MNTPAPEVWFSAGTSKGHYFTVLPWRGNHAGRVFTILGKSADMAGVDEQLLALEMDLA